MRNLAHNRNPGSDSGCASNSGTPRLMRRLWSSTALVLTLTILAGCAAQMTRDDGLNLITEGRYEDGLAKLQDAGRIDSKDATYRLDYLRQRDLIVSRLIANAFSARAAGKPDAAGALYRRVLGIETSNARATAGLVELGAERRQALLLEEAKALYKKGDEIGRAHV